MAAVDTHDEVDDSPEDLEEALGTEDTFFDDGQDDDVVADSGDDESLMSAPVDTDTSPDPDAEYLESLGLGNKYGSVEDALKAHVEAQRHIGEISPLVNMGRQAQEHWPQFQEYMQHQQQAQFENQPDPFWNPPSEHDDQLKRLEAMAEAHGEGWNEAMGQEDAEKLNNFVGYRNDFWRRVHNNPNTITDELVMPAVHDAIEDAFRRRDLQHHANSFAQGVSDILQESPENYQQIQNLIGQGTPGKVAERLVRAEMKLAQMEGKVSKVSGKEQDLKNKKQQLRRRSKIRGKAGGRPQLDINVDKDSYEDIASKMLDAHRAGLLDEGVE